jgi:cytochrome c oxidase subunit II
MTQMEQEPMKRVARAAATAVRLALWTLPLLLSACFPDVRQSTVHPMTDTGRVIQDVYKMVTWIDTIIFILVAGLLAWALWRYRESNSPAGEIPEQVHGNPVLELIWTIVPAVILIFIAVPTWSGIFRGAAPPQTTSMKVKAIGHQWWWEFQYTDINLTTANELHVPIGRPIEILTSSKDVIHSFWVPRLAGKIDAFPEKENLVWFTPEVEGMYYGQCAEFCSTSHANMRFRVVVDSQANFDAWVARTQKPQVAKSDDAKAGEQLFTNKGCVICHTINGKTQAALDIAPNLTNLADRTTIASALLDKTDENLTRWIKDPRGVKPGVMMCFPPQMDRTSPDCGKFDVTDAEIKQLIAFLNSPTAGATADMAKPAAVVAQQSVK